MSFNSPSVFEPHFTLRVLYGIWLYNSPKLPPASPPNKLATPHHAKPLDRFSEANMSDSNENETGPLQPSPAAAMLRKTMKVKMSVASAVTNKPTTHIEPPMMRRIFRFILSLIYPNTSVAIPVTRNCRLMDISTPLP